jgi:hypothetical protein
MRLVSRLDEVLFPTRSQWSRSSARGNAQLASMLTARELSRRCAPLGVAAFSCAHSHRSSSSGSLRSLRAGLAAVLFCAVSPLASAGGCFDERLVDISSSSACSAELSRAARDNQLAAGLFERTEQEIDNWRVRHGLQLAQLRSDAKVDALASLQVQPQQQQQQHSVLLR